MRGLGISQASLAFSKHIVTQFGLHGKYFLCVLKKKKFPVYSKKQVFFPLKRFAVSIFLFILADVTLEKGYFARI